jgi:hypothetical protein
MCYINQWLTIRHFRVKIYRFPSKIGFEFLLNNELMKNMNSETLVLKSLQKVKVCPSEYPFPTAVHELDRLFLYLTLKVINVS